MDGVRRHQRRSRALATVMACWLVAGAAAAAPASSAPEECGATAAADRSLPCDVVAAVGDESITLAEFEHWFAVARKSGGGEVELEPPRFTACVEAKRETLPASTQTTSRQLREQCAAEYEALRDQVMSLLVSFTWIRGEAERQGVRASAAEVRAQFREQKRASFPKHEQYLRFLRDSGQTEADLLMRVELDLLSSKIRERVTRNAAPVTRREIERYYDRNRGRFVLPERRDIRLVLAKNRRKAVAARARIEAGEPWRSVAKDLSIDPSSRSRGGRLDGLAEGQQGRKLERALFTAERGELQGPVGTRFGWYVFEVTKIRPSGQMPFERARRTIADLLESQRRQVALDAFVKTFTRRWRARTICREGYRTADCANGPSRPAPSPIRRVARIR